MRVETICLLIGVVMCAILSTILLAGRGKKIIEHAYPVWGVISAMSLIPTFLLLVYLLTSRFEFCYVVEHTNRELCFIYKISALWSSWHGAMLLWSVILCIVGGMAVRYAKRYDKRILGIYSAITGCVMLFALFGNPFEIVPKVQDGVGAASIVKDPFMLLYPIFILAGFSAVALLASLGVVAERRPVKVKRWIRIGFLLLGIGMLLESIWGYRCLEGGELWTFHSREIQMLVPWLVLCASLHGKRYYSKYTCIVPFALIIYGTVFTENKIILCVVTIIAIAIFGIFMAKKEGHLIHAIDYKNHMELFRVSTYVYAGILFVEDIICTIGGLAGGRVFCYAVSGCYVLVIVGLLLLEAKPMSILRYIAIIVWNTAITLIVLWLYPQFYGLMLVFFWICLFPVTFFFAEWKTSIRSERAIGHLLLSMMMIGILLYYGVHLDQTEGVAGGGSPLCYIFWIGGLTMFLYTAICIVRQRLN